MNPFDFILEVAKAYGINSKWDYGSDDLICFAKCHVWLLGAHFRLKARVSPKESSSGIAPAIFGASIMSILKNILII